MENSPTCEILNAVLGRLGPWHRIELHSIGPSTIELSVGGVRVEIRVQEWYAGHRRFATCIGKIDYSDQDRFFIQHLCGILNGMTRDDQGRLVAA